METEFPRGRGGPRRKIMEIPGGGEYHETPYNRKSWGVEVRPPGGMNLFLEPHISLEFNVVKK